MSDYPDDIRRLIAGRCSVQEAEKIVRQLTAERDTARLARDMLLLEERLRVRKDLAIYIVAARNALPALLEERKRLREEPT